MWTADVGTHDLAPGLRGKPVGPAMVPRRQPICLAVPQPRVRGAEKILSLFAGPRDTRQPEPASDAVRGRTIRLLDIRLSRLAAGQPGPARLDQRAVFPRSSRAALLAS